MDTRLRIRNHPVNVCIPADQVQVPIGESACADATDWTSIYQVGQIRSSLNVTQAICFDAGASSDPAPVVPRLRACTVDRRDVQLFKFNFGLSTIELISNPGQCIGAVDVTDTLPPNNAAGSGIHTSTMIIVTSCDDTTLWNIE